MMDEDDLKIIMATLFCITMYLAYITYTPIQVDQDLSTPLYLVD